MGRILPPPIQMTYFWNVNFDSAVDEWAGDYGCGVKYFSQDGVIKLAPNANIKLDDSLSPAEKLKIVQKKYFLSHIPKLVNFQTLHTLPFHR